ncbi:hypothetical protein Q4I30_002985 [Leishmania utingensis]|uniref:Uncharacterized protein n=1 Tax=Leishmania utingensis TaxID=653362 RepID=A0AAW3AQU9_9TRYP
MERVESMLSALTPILKRHQLGSWKPAEVERLCTMLRKYGKQEPQEECGAYCNSGATTTAASLPSPSSAPSPPSSRDDNVQGESDTDEEAFVGAISEVDRCLNLVRNFLKRRMPFGVVVEPTVPAGTAEPQAPQSSITGTSSKKRARSPSGEARVSAPASNGVHSGAAVVAAPVYAVDAFLYSEADIEKLVEAKKVAREYCCRCGSTDIRLSEFITHSFSQDQLLYLSCFLLPHLLEVVVASDEASRPLSIVDVGSRLGIVLWACAFALQWGILAPQRSVAAAPEVQLVGIELDATFVKISQDTVRRFFAPRRRHAPKLSLPLQTAGADDVSSELADVSSSIQLLQSDCFEGDAAAVLCSSALVVMHNVFEYFCASAVEHARCWLKLHRLVHRSGQLLVCSPALEVTFGTFTEEVWLQACQLENEKDAGATSTPLAWLESYVEPFDTNDVTSDFLTLRALSREGCNSDGDGTVHDENQHDHHHGHRCGHLHHSRSEADEGDEEAVSEAVEQIQRIYVYRVK